MPIDPSKVKWDEEPAIDPAQVVWDEPVARDYEPTGATSTITAKPETKFTGEGGPGASWGANFKVSWVNDPTVKAAIYAQSRFPDLAPEQRKKRYAVKNGEVFYRDDDGKWRSETPDMFGNKVKTFIQQFTGAPALSAAMTGAGEALGGIPGGIAGAEASEGIRQAVASKVFGEDINLGESLAGFGTEGLAAAAGGGLSRIGGKMTNAGLRAQGGKIARLGLNDLTDTQLLPTHQRLGAVGQRYGISAPVPATTKSPQLQFAYNRLADLPETSRMMVDDRRRLAGEVVDGVYKFLDEIHPATSASEAGERVVQAGQSAIERITNKRAAKAKPYYDQAYLTQLDDNAVADLLNDPVVRDAVEYVKGKPIYRRELATDDAGEVAANDFKLYDLAKRRIDDQIEVAKRSGTTGRNEVRLLKGAKDELVQKLDALSPDYKNARKVFGDYSLELERAGKKTTLSEISTLEGDRVLTAAKRMFSPTQNAPERVKVQKELIQKEDPEAWNGALRMYLQDIFEQYKPPRSGEANPAGWFSQMTTGKQSQDKILQAALEPWQYENLKGLNELMHEISNLYRTNSNTADKQWFDKILAGVGGKAKTFFEWLQPREKSAKWAEERYTAMNTKLITEAIFDPNVAVQLRRVRQVPKGTLQWVESVAAAFAAGGMQSTDYPYQFVSPRKWKGQQ